MSMSEGAMEPDKLCETTVKIGRKLWTLDGMVERILGKAREAMEARAADRGPDPDAITEDDERVMIPVRMFEQMMRRVGPGPGSSSGGANKLGWLITLNIAITVAAVSWVASTLIEQGKDIAVIKCQLNPSSCPQVRP